MFDEGVELGALGIVFWGVACFFGGGDFCFGFGAEYDVGVFLCGVVYECFFKLFEFGVEFVGECFFLCFKVGIGVDEL